jgi:uncharacterized protein (TIGR03545 family)
MMKMIRWSGLIAFIVIVALIAVFNLLFLDGIIKGIVEDQASLAVGARVEIADLRFKVFGLSVDIRDLQVTNPEQPMRNAVEVGTLAFDLATAPLLKKKIVIERMKVVDLAWDTPRKTSGALPARLQKKLEARKKRLDIGTTAEKRLEECVLPDLSILTDLKKRSPEDLLKGINLQSAASIAEYRTKVSTVRESWEKQLANLPTRETIDADLKELQSLKDRRPTDLTQLPAYFDKVKTLQQKLETTKKSLVDAQQKFQTEMGNLKGSLKEVEKLKDQDLKTAMSKLGIQLPSAVDLVCVLFGKEVAQKVNWAVAWYRKLNRFMPTGKPKKEKEEPKPVPRMKGVDIRFPITRGYPDFLLHMAEFSVRPDVKKAQGRFAFEKLSGELRGLTTHPALYGNPTIVRLQGSIVGDMAREVALSGQLDHRSEPADDRIDFMIKELSVKQSDVATPKESPLRLDSATLNVNGYLNVKGEALKGRAVVDVLRPKVTVGSSATILADLFKNMGSFDVTISIDGTLDQPSMSLSSSATKALTSGLQNLVQPQISKIQNDVKKAIASRVDGDITTAGRETDTLEKVIQGELSKRLNLAGTIPKQAPAKEEPGKKRSPADLLKEKGLPF